MDFENFMNKKLGGKFRAPPAPSTPSTPTRTRFAPSVHSTPTSGPRCMTRQSPTSQQKTQVVLPNRIDKIMKLSKQRMKTKDIEGSEKETDLIENVAQRESDIVDKIIEKEIQSNVVRVIGNNITSNICFFRTNQEEFEDDNLDAVETVYPIDAVSYGAIAEGERSEVPLTVESGLVESNVATHDVNDEEDFTNSQNKEKENTKGSKRSTA